MRKIIKGKIIKMGNGIKIQCADEEHIGDFVFRPPIKNHRIEDEFFFDAGKYFIHLEYMSVQGIWIGISTSNGSKTKVLHLDFFVGDKKVRDEVGKMVYPLLLGVRNEEMA